MRVFYGLRRGVSLGGLAERGRRAAPLALALLAIVMWSGCSKLREEIGPGGARNRPLTYVDDIKPLLETHCTSCHNSTDPVARYDLTQYDTGPWGGILGPGTDGVPNVIPGAGTSKLVETIELGGSMRSKLGADREKEAAAITTWVVADSARKE